MAAPDPTCTVADGGGAPQATTNGVNVTAANTITIQLASLTGVNVWSISIYGQDELISPPSLSINPTTKTCTFTAPTAPWSLIFKSVVNNGVDVNGQIQDSYTTTFKICTLTGSSLRLGASNETGENSALYGWVGVINGPIRGGGGGGDSPGGADNDFQYRVNSTTLGGATGFTRETSTNRFNTTTRAVELGAGTTNYAASGDFRGRSGFIAKITNVAGTTLTALHSLDTVLAFGSTTTQTEQYPTLQFYGVTTVALGLGSTTHIGLTSGLTRIESGRLVFGTSAYASAGDVGFKKAATVKARNSADSGDLTGLQLGTSGANDLYVGGTSAFTEQYTNIKVHAATDTTIGVGSAVNFRVLSGLTQIETGRLVFGTSGQPTVGEIGLKNNQSIYFRNAADSGNIRGMTVDVADNMYIGGTFAGGTLPAELYLSANGNIIVTRVATVHMIQESGSVSIGAVPIVGYSTDSSPYGVHGGVAVTFVADADYAVTSVQYKYDWLEFITGSWASGHTITFPHPSSLARGYYKTIFNNTSFTATISTGTGSTRTLATALGQRFFFSDAGVKFAGPTFTP